MVNLYFIKTIPFLLLTALLLACQEKEAVDQQTELKLYYLTCWNRGNSPDTLDYNKICKVDPRDSMLARKHFFYRNQQHVVEMYTSDYHAPIDGGSLYYALDSLGVFYGKSTTWPGFSKLSSNNDSINDLISTALGFVLSESSLHCYHCREEFMHNEPEIQRKEPESNVN